MRRILRGGHLAEVGVSKTADMRSGNPKSPFQLVAAPFHRTRRSFAAAHRLIDVIEQPFLDPIPRYLLWVALGAWIATAIGLLHQQLRGLRRM
jgi:hypothetical protein